MDLPYSNESMISHLTQAIIISIRTQENRHHFVKTKSELSNKITNELIIQCLNYIDNNLASDLSLAHLAKMLSISTSYL